MFVLKSRTFFVSFIRLACLSFATLGAGAQYRFTMPGIPEIQATLFPIG